MKARRSCELCGAAAALHCEADSAFLCFSCDRKVHGANFLVARHIRRLSCSHCKSLTAGEFSGGGPAPVRSLCASCDDTAASDSGGGRRRGAMAGVPRRAVLAAALWYAAEARGCKSERVLRRLEECSGVPAKIIVRVTERLARRPVKVEEEEEGRSEC